MFNQKLSTRVQASQSKVGVFRSGLFVQVGLVVLVLVGAVAVALAADNAAKRAAEQRAVEAYAARWTGLGQEHLLRESRRERAQAADEARWNGLAEMYDAQRLSRAKSWAAYADRYAALAAAYGQPMHAQTWADTLAARYTGQALALYARTGQPALLPNCVAAQTLAHLPAIGDGGWRAEVTLCAD